MEMFVRVVEEGGFSAAAREANMTASAVSKLMGRLEKRLGTRLLHRTTRQFRLTPEGEAFYQRAIGILADLNDAENAAGAGERASGRVRVNSSASYVTHVLARILPAFLERYPEISLDIVQTDSVVDILAEQFDVAIRAGPMINSRLMARKLGATRMMIVAAPAWIMRHGMPTTVEELARQDSIGFGYTRAVKGWPLRWNDQDLLLPTRGRVQISDGEGIRQLALAGVGPARLARFTIEDDLASGRLIPLLENYNAEDREDFHAVFVGRSDSLPARARALLDHLAEFGRVE